MSVLGFMQALLEMNDLGLFTLVFPSSSSVLRNIQVFLTRKQLPLTKTRQSKQCGFSIYTFDNLKSISMVRLVRAEKMVLSCLVFARKIARMILIQNIQGLMGPLMINMAFMPLYM